MLLLPGDEGGANEDAGSMSMGLPGCDGNALKLHGGDSSKRVSKC